MKRFDHDADSPESLKNYILNRRLQLIGEGAELLSLEFTDYGALAKWIYNQENYASIFLSPKARGQGAYLKIKKTVSEPILTVPDCDVELFLKVKQVPHKVLNRFMESSEYQSIQSFYGDKKAERSGVYLMNHIDEGLAILDWINAGDEAKKAFCLHPILQSDADLGNNFKNISPQWSIKAVALAMEYRSVANEYLSHRNIQSLDEIRLSPLTEVNLMLWADKIQNFKDFTLYHKDSHPRSQELENYFNNWIQKLQIPQETVLSYWNKLNPPKAL